MKYPLLVILGLGTFGCSAAPTVDPHDAAGDAASDAADPPDEGAVDAGSDALPNGSDAAADADGGTSGARKVFISSTTTSGYMGGAAGADAICNTAAKAAGLSGTYVAWLSTSTASASSRVSHAGGPFVLIDGTVVALDWAGLTSGALLTGINENEHGVAVPYSATGLTGVAFTGSDVSGNAITNLMCFDWTQGSNTGGACGNDQSTNMWWTDEGQFGCPCNYVLALYCIEN